jgi:rRNA-processing protein FCF1
LKEIDKLIILDSNFLLVPIQFKIDYLEEITLLLEGKCKFIVFQQVIDELQAKKSRYEKLKKSAKFETQLNAGLLYLERKKKKFNIQFVDIRKKKNENTDEFLLRKITQFQQENKPVYLATNDYELRKQAKSLCPVFFVRQEKFISLLKK